MLEPLSKKDKKYLFEVLNSQFSFNKPLNYNFFINQEKKIFILNKNLQIDFSKIRINNLGLYFANIDNELRLTIEGSQIIGPYSDKNILNVTDAQLNEWMYGNDLQTTQEFNGFVLIKNKNDFYGTGKFKENKILNFIPKERRLKN